MYGEEDDDRGDARSPKEGRDHWQTPREREGEEEKERVSGRV